MRFQRSYRDFEIERKRQERRYYWPMFLLLGVIVTGSFILIVLTLATLPND